MTNKTSAKLAAAALCFAVLGVLAAGAAESIADKCAAEFQKVTQCLSFVTAKAAAPSKDCCTSVTELKDDDPACLCYIIQQVHNGSNAAVKSMGVQESRLLQLPSACKLANASTTQCPKLLNLPPNSPDAAIFTNASTNATTTPVATPGATGAPSKGDWQKPGVAGCLTVAMAIFVHAFPLF
ncbi:non-specific lipid transfer protein GPI-anchored 1 [Salvia miltiorrhiza]|uniref:non-specific lipid transfer protein GPI-anchored 1 n=1 Tax=Salvia miltiorrhiza TaxID=226208 RepID=UPI0025AC96D5|nr:non-specific lipid transfer protein GPI-anchored 1 [Salvia miltiorrhiza]